MNTRTNVPEQDYVIAAALGGLAVVLMLVFFSGAVLPVISSARAVFFILAFIGIAMCTLGGIGPAIKLYGWSNPITLLGSLLGLMALVLIAAVLFDLRLPLVTNEREAVIALALIGLVKVILAGVQRATVRAK
jgi:hypothetical protein